VRPPWADERVAIAEPDPVWPERAASLIAGLEVALSPYLHGGVHHVGSTAVFGLAAKPIIDLMAGVASLDVAVPGGWHLVPPELDARPWRRLWVLADGARRIAHLHLMIEGSERWHQQLRFRDRLRADPELRDRYAALKGRLAAEHASDREAYGAAKADFVARYSGKS
jgi:GrpB-like predicted nucleotidyltransferase (UPF0157 family)